MKINVNRRRHGRNRLVLRAMLIAALAAAAPVAAAAAVIPPGAVAALSGTPSAALPAGGAAQTLRFASVQSASLALEPPAPEQAGLEAKLNAEAERWIGRLAQEAPFAQWRNAASRIEALGPGTHAWIATVLKDGRAVGYLILYAAEDGSFRLGEYGTGSQPLFDAAALKRSLVENGLIRSRDAESGSYQATRHYFHPFAAMWEVNTGEDTYWLDAKTAELLPIRPDGWAELKARLASASRTSGPPAPDADDRPALLTLNETFDPYERLPWLMDERPYASDGAKLKQRLDAKGHLRFVATPFGESMLYALPVVGYQEWSSSRLDLALDMAGLRFIPAETLMDLGLFYR
ncbi:hypothetical protein [Cohnella laeviribosi]|nr:hypothetical protein [Cohnella laeviribosi]